MVCTHTLQTAGNFITVVTVLPMRLSVQREPSGMITPRSVTGIIMSIVPPHLVSGDVAWIERAGVCELD